MKKYVAMVRCLPDPGLSIVDRYNKVRSILLDGINRALPSGALPKRVEEQSEGGVSREFGWNGVLSGRLVLCEQEFVENAGFESATCDDWIFVETNSEGALSQVSALFEASTKDGSVYFSWVGLGDMVLPSGDFRKELRNVPPVMYVSNAMFREILPSYIKRRILQRWQVSEREYGCVCSMVDVTEVAALTPGLIEKEQHALARRGWFG